MFEVIKKMFIGLLSTCATGYFDGLLACNSKGHIKYIPLSNEPCQARPTFIDINSNEPLFSSIYCQCLKVWWKFQYYWWLYVWVFVPAKVTIWM